jgi:cyclic pyranopterin phosphate synthase
VAAAQALVHLPLAIFDHLPVQPPASSGPGFELSAAKGPVLATAIVAGTQAVKQTSTLIPFCHPLPIDKCKFHTELLPLESSAAGCRTLRIVCTVSCEAKTGVEMEALTGASVAALTVYDMLKALSHSIVIDEICLLSKTGGKSAFQQQRNEQ